MHPVRLGTAIVECLRVRRLVERHGEQFLTLVFTGREIRAGRDRAQSAELLAARWAVKQAVLDCLGASGPRRRLWGDLEVRLKAGGRAEVLLGGAARELARGSKLGALLVSTAYCRAYATATAIAYAPPA
jgi:holo-[acyl-carrier protein] synthase